MVKKGHKRDKTRVKGIMTKERWRGVSDDVTKGWIGEKE